VGGARLLQSPTSIPFGVADVHSPFSVGISGRISGVAGVIGQRVSFCGGIGAKSMVAKKWRGVSL